MSLLSSLLRAVGDLEERPLEVGRPADELCDELCDRALGRGWEYSLHSSPGACVVYLHTHTPRRTYVMAALGQRPPEDLALAALASAYLEALREHLEQRVLN